MYSFTLSLILSFISLDSTLFAISLKKISTISTICSRPSESKTTVSSRRFKNSGLNVVFKLSSFKFEVKIIIVFVKSTVIPLLSVKRPSSKTCSKILKTSLCAFSTSSKSITLYGLRLTDSVSCPPSS